MKKNHFSPRERLWDFIPKLFLRMKLTAFLFLLGIFAASANSFSQVSRFDFQYENVTIKEVFNEISVKSNYHFFYSNDDFDANRKVNINVRNATIEQILNHVLGSNDLSFKIIDDAVIISKQNVKWSSDLASQPLTITGKVTDSSGGPLPGVTIVLKGTTKGTISAADGSYVINNVPSDATLLFSFVGMKTQEVTVSGKSIINISLAEETVGLNEVVAIGYGEVRKRDLTGSVSKVTESETIARQYNSVDAVLQGRAAGVQVSSNAGNPGQSISVRIRGTNSLSGNNEPLYVVDGVIVNSAGEDVLNAVNDGNEYQTPQNGLTGINPKDIESIEVLKDASATAIYGSRGANGVVLITTKKGEKGKSKINVYSTVDFSVIAKKIDLMDALTYAQYRNELQSINNDNPVYKIQDNDIYLITYTIDGSGQEVANVGSTPLQQINWQNEMYKLGISHNDGVTISGANDKTNYYFSAGYTDQNGIVDNSKLLNGDLRLNLSQQLTPKLKIDTRIGINYMDLNFAHSGNKSGSNRSFTLQVLRYSPLLTSDESVDIENELSNPYAFVNDFDDKSKELRLNAVNSVEYEFTKGFKYKFLIGLDYRNKDRSRWYGVNIYKGKLENGDLGISGLTRYSYTMNHLLLFNKRFNKLHKLGATIGFTYDGSNSKYSNYEVGDFPVKTLRTKSPQAAQSILGPLSYNYQDEAIESLIGRVNYSFKDKYLITSTFRADGASKFGIGNKWGYFPSIALAWRASEEGFIKNVNLFDNLKVRAGWGQTGNQAISPYSTLSHYGPSTTSNYIGANNNRIVGNVVSGIANPDLTWETTDQLNVGVDFGLIKNRLTGSIDAYSKKTRDLLQEMQIGPSNGFTTMPVNLGEISNKGIELTFNFRAVDKKDFNVEVGGKHCF